MAEVRFSPAETYNLVLRMAHGSGLCEETRATGRGSGDGSYEIDTKS